MQFNQKHSVTAVLFLICMQGVAQPKRDIVGTLVAAENYFAANAKEKGVKEAFIQALDERSVLLRKGAAVNGLNFYKSLPAGQESLWWEPVYARVSKSANWGFTTGPAIFKPTANGAESYGDYFSIWQRNRKGVWKLLFDIGVTHPKPTTQQKLHFVNPQSDKFFRQRGEKRLQQRQEIVTSSDKLYATILKADNKIARKEFINENCLLLIDGAQAMYGREKISAFWEKEGSRLTTEVISGGRAESGELAWTYGNATIITSGKAVPYHYLRVWELQPEFKWNVIAEVYTVNGTKP